MGNLAQLRELIFLSDNHACFIERERILARLKTEMRDYSKPDKYPLIIARLLSEVSTPVMDCDYFAGRVIEAFPDEGMHAANLLLNSMGHMHFDYKKVLSYGLKGILAEIKENALKKGDAESLIFAENAEIIVQAVRNYTGRYAMEARKHGFEQMACALEHVPYEPAYDFYSALQGIWIIYMIASCYVGSRDYAFGRFDQYMLPFYEKALADGATEEELTELLAGFFMKTNEICGRAAWNYEGKPVLSHSSKQYVNIGGEHPNAFSNVILKAAVRCNMAQPQIVVLLKPEADAIFTDHVFDALTVLTDKMNIYNYDLILNHLLQKGINEELAKGFTFSACCSLDLDYHASRMCYGEYYVPAPKIFLDVITKKEYASLEEILDEFENML